VGQNTGEGVTLIKDSAGPLELRHLRSEAFQRVSDTTPISSTHWHVAFSNALGWAFDGMDLAILGLVAPQLLKEFGLTVGEFRDGVQIFGLATVFGCFVWPWLADRYGRKTLLSINIALFSLAMPVAASAPSWAIFVFVYSIVRFTLAGEWAIGAPLVVETWPARYRGLVLGANRSAFSLGSALAGLLTTFIVVGYGWRAAFYLPGLVALLAVYIRLLVPESPEWVRTQDRMSRIKTASSSGIALSPDDREWFAKAKRPGITQLFLKDMRRNTALVTIVYTGVLVSFAAITQFMPLYLSEAHHWSTQEYGRFVTWWGLVGIPAYWIAGGSSDRYGRRRVFVVALLWAAIFLAIWAYATDHVALWVLGLIWSFGYAGIYGPLASYISELYPTRVRSLGTGFTLGVATLIAYVLWPYVLIWVRTSTGSFSICFLLSSAALLIVAAVVWLFSPESARKELDALTT
jgi:MFS transporter, putative metabolite:H+ symporter